MNSPIRSYIVTWEVFSFYLAGAIFNSGSFRTYVNMVSIPNILTVKYLLTSKNIYTIALWRTTDIVLKVVLEIKTTYKRIFRLNL